MKPVLVLYATREGHSQRIAEHVAAGLRTRGLTAEVQNAQSLTDSFDLARYGAALLAASLHRGKHEREMVTFVKDHLDALHQMPTAFLSASLTEAGAEDPTATAAQREKAAAQAWGSIERFFAETGWRADRIKAVAGALLFSRYGFLTRLVLRMISKRAGSTTDSSRDHEFTDWGALDHFVDEFAAAVVTPATA